MIPGLLDLIICGISGTLIDAPLPPCKGFSIRIKPRIRIEVVSAGQGRCMVIPCINSD